MAIVKWIEKHKVLTSILFFGFWILLLWWLMAKNNNTPDLNAPLPPEPEECTSPSGDVYPC